MKGGKKTRVYYTLVRTAVERERVKERKREREGGREGGRERKGNREREGGREGGRERETKRNYFLTSVVTCELEICELEIELQYFREEAWPWESGRGFQRGCVQSEGW